MEKRPSQKKMILDHLERWGAISPGEALSMYQCMRLAPRIMELKEDGVKIITRMMSNTESGKSYAVYYLEEYLNGGP